MLQFYIAPSAPLLHGRTLYLKGQLVGDDGAMKYYQAARPPHAALMASSINDLEKRMYLLGKQDATYWCGLIVYQRGDYDAAVDYSKSGRSKHTEVTAGTAAPDTISPALMKPPAKPTGPFCSTEATPHRPVTKAICCGRNG